MSDPYCWSASSEKPGCAAERFKATIAELTRELAAAQAKLAERDESFERLFQKAMAHDSEVAKLREKLARYEAAGRELPEEPTGAEWRIERIWQYAKQLRAFAAAQKLRADENELDAKRLREWLDNNTTFYNVDADWPVEGNNIPTLAQVSNRIWYHATDDETSFPFSKVIDAAIKEQA